MRRLTRTANGDIANRDDGDGIRLALQDVHLKEHVPELHAQAVQPTQRQQFLVDSDEIPFHP